MRVVVFIGLPYCGLEEFQTELFDHREALLSQGVLVPQFGKKRSHSRLYMAVSDPDRPDPLRYMRGFAQSDQQDKLRRALRDDLVAARQSHPEASSMVLASSHLATLPNRSELDRLKALLDPVSQDVSIFLTIGEQARLLLRHYDDAVQAGRTRPLADELDLARSGGDWSARALSDWTAAQATPGRFAEVFAIPHWIDHAAVAARWQDAFGAGKVTLLDPSAFRPDATGAVAALAPLLPRPIRWKSRASAATPQPALTDTALARWRRVNQTLHDRLGDRFFAHRKLASSLRPLIDPPGSVTGRHASPGALSPISDHFAKGNAALLSAHPSLDPAILRPEPPLPLWSEQEAPDSFDPAAIIARLDPDLYTLPEDLVRLPARDPAPATAAPSLPAALRDVPDEIAQALAAAHQLKGTPYEPHNRLGSLDETRIDTPFPDEKPPSSNAIIVGCMKNEAPYIVEWVAYHRQIGFDGFLIYTNDCSDGTDAILDRLQTLGYVQHRNNDEWKGQSPQQHALNMSLKEKILRDAAWVAHIDVDEFVNIRVGNGTVADLLAQMPDATNIAMTWRLFGHNGVERLQDDLVIAQFDHAAPRYCPKPHTNWGFKTMTRNLGTYEKLSCHRPTKPVKDRLDALRWYNGSGKVMSAQYHEKGWRSDRANIGYDLVQLNHYALRSAEAFLVKRQRGRALHVDRSIGLSYWMRMDWNSHPDMTIKRNIPRVRAEMDRMFQDAELRRLQEEALAWHRAKIAELHALPEFAELYKQVMDIRLSEIERVAVSLALEK